MPIRDALDPFFEDYDKLTLQQKRRFLAAVRELVTDLKEGRQPRPGLHVHRLRGHPGIWAMAWAPDGRATFHYGAEILDGQAHLVWRRIGDHEIYENP